MSRHNPNDDSSTEAETITVQVNEIEANRVTKRIQLPGEDDNIIATTKGDTATTVFADGQMGVSFTLKPHHDEYATGTLVFVGSEGGEINATAQFCDADGNIAKTLHNPRMDTVIVHDDEDDDDE